MSINMEKSGTSLDQQFSLPYAIPRVNLLPPEVIERRQVRKAKSGVAAATVLVLGLVGGLFVLASSQKSAAEEDLAAEQSRTAELRKEEAKYAEVPQIISTVEAARTARSQALKNDVNVATVLNNIASVYPSTVWVDTLSITINDPNVGPPSTTVDPLAESGIGTFQFTGKTYESGKYTHNSVAAWLESLKRVNEVSSARLQQSTLSEVDKKIVTTFTNTGVLNEQALTHRYDGEAN